MPSTLSRWKRQAVQTVFDRFMRWRLPDLLRPEYPVILKYPIRPESRYGEGKPAHPELARFFARQDAAYRATLTDLAEFAEPLAQIAETSDAAGPGQPYWQNIFFTALDAIALYSLLASRKPARYLEVGSGNSTKFARRAVRDMGLPTQIISIDPHPRADVDRLCDCVIRKPFEDVDPALFSDLGPDDVLFVDSSHVVFQNSDVSVFFLEVLPRLRAGVTVHIHDIFLPFDYPSLWSDRHYSEQYLLAAYVLGGANRLRVLLPLAHVSHDPQLRAIINQFWGHPRFERAFAYNSELTGGYAGTSLWLEIV